METRNAIGAAGAALPAVMPAGKVEKLVRHRWILAGVGSTLATVLVLLFLSTRLYVYDAVAAIEPAASIAASPEEAAALRKEVTDLDGKAKRAERNLGGLVPSSVYIVVDTAQNKLYLKRRD